MPATRRHEQLEYQMATANSQEMGHIRRGLESR
jgi:hypothetical protein